MWWQQAHGNKHMATSTWQQAHGNRHMATSSVLSATLQEQLWKLQETLWNKVTVGTQKFQDICVPSNLVFNGATYKFSMWGESQEAILTSKKRFWLARWLQLRWKPKEFISKFSSTTQLTADLNNGYESPTHAVPTDLRPDLVWWDNQQKSCWTDNQLWDKLWSSSREKGELASRVRNTSYETSGSWLQRSDNPVSLMQITKTYNVRPLNTCLVYKSKVIIWPQRRPCGPTDKASDYGSGDSRFESWQGRFFFFSCFFFFLLFFSPLHTLNFTTFSSLYIFSKPVS